MLLVVMGKKSPPKLLASAASKGDRRSPIRFKKQRRESAQRLPQRFEPFSIGTQLPNHRQNAHLTRLIVSNPDTGDQVTTWQYGTTLATDGIARTDLLKAKIYPLDVNAIGQVTRQTTFAYDCPSLRSRPAKSLRSRDAAIAAKQWTAIAGIPSQREAFDYDAIGNWKDYLRQSDGLTTLNQERRHNQDNQLIELNANASGLSYDANGNMTACRPDKDGDWSKGYTMVWDAWNRLVVVRNAQTSATVASYAYDGLTRRTTTTIGSTVRRFYYNDVWKCVEERLGSSSNPDRLYYWSTRTGHRDELLRRDRATSGGAINETLWCLMDYFDPIAVVNGTGVVQERYSYTAFGLASMLTPAFAARAVSSFAWNFLFHGQFRDAETGWDNYGFRYYLPWLGRWTDRDPIQEEGGLNVYSWDGNSPINVVDLLGRGPNCCIKPQIKDDCNKCCEPGTIKPCAGLPLKNCCNCGGKKKDDKDKPWWRKIFPKEIKIESEGEVGKEPKWKFELKWSWTPPAWR